MVDFNFIQKRLKPIEPLEVDFSFGENAYRLLEGTTYDMSAIWADPKASRTSGKFYVGSTGIGAALSIVDLKFKLLYDRYTYELKGRANESLVQEDLKDIII